MGRIISKISLIAAILTGLLGTLPSTVSAAGSATLSLSPSGGSYKVGTTFSVRVNENSGSNPVNVVEANFSYNSSRIKLVGISCNSGAFEVSAPGSGSGITCGTSSPKTGSQTVAVANFKALAAGSAVVSFASSSHIYSSSNTDIWNGSTSGANYGFFVPVAAPKPAAPQVQAATTPPPAAAPTPVVTPPVTKAPVAVVPKKKSSWPAYLGTTLAAIIIAAGIVKRKKLAEVTKPLRSKVVSSSKKMVAMAPVVVPASTSKKSTKKSARKKK